MHSKALYAQHLQFSAYVSMNAQHTNAACAYICMACVITCAMHAAVSTC